MSTVDSNVLTGAPLPLTASLYRSIFERSTDAIGILAPDGTYIEQNEAHARLTGWSIAELRGRTPAVHLGAETFDRILRRLQTDGYYSGEVESRDRSGYARTVELSCFPVQDETGGVVAWVGAKRDVSARRAAEVELRRRVEQLTALYRMASAVSRAVDLDAIFQEGIDCLCATLRAERASLLLLDGDGVMRFRASRNLSAAYREAVEGHSPWDVHDPAPATIVIGDVAADRSLDALRAAVQRERIEALVFVPLVSQQKLLGKFMLYFDRPHTPGREELQHAEAVASHIAAAIARRRAEDEVARRQREFEALAEHSPDIIVRFDRELRHLYINSAVEQSTGIPAATFIGRTNAELGMPDHVVRQWEPTIRRVFRTGEPANLEFTFDTPAGPRCLQARVNPEIVEAGLVVTVISTTRDVTDLKRAETRQRLLAEVGAAMVTNLDYHEALGEVARLVVGSFANGCAIDLARIDGSLERLALESRDQRHAELVRELESRYPSPTDGNAGHVRAFRTGEPLLFTELSDELLRSASRDDEHFRMWKALRMRAVINAPLIARGRTIGVMTFAAHEPALPFTGDDLTFACELAGRVALAVDNLRLYDQAMVANRAKSDFMATISHELRTPLNAIMGYTDLLDLRIGGPLTDRQDEQLGRIRTSTAHLLTVIEEILTFSRVEAGKEDIEIEDIDAARIAGEAVAMIEPVAVRKGLSFTAELPAEPVAGRTDPVRLRQVLLNLLGNAVKFTPSGSVSLTMTASDDALRFDVRDTGIGIAATDLDRIFEPFWQAHSGTTRSAGGTGLGLTVSRQLVSLLGGELDVESRPGEGSVFSVTIPRFSAPS